METPAAESSPSPDSIASIRSFNRFYTRTIGTLEEGLLSSQFSLAEARVLYEIASRERPTPSEIASVLSLDSGYLSRILGSFTRRKLLTRTASATDGRQAHLSLTAAGQREFATLNQRSSTQVRDMLAPLPPEQQIQLVASMRSIESILNPSPSPQPFILRSHRPGDIGWVIERHGLLYSREYGWDQRFEALVAHIAAGFIENFNPARERCWIADRNGERLGCVFLVQDCPAESAKPKKKKSSRKKSSPPQDTARLRLLLVEPSARSLGLGRTLVRECSAFARAAGYKRIVLWTNSVLTSARHIYEQEGYTLLREEPYTAFGKDLVSQDWQLDL